MFDVLLAHKVNSLVTPAAMTTTTMITTTTTTKLALAPANQPISTKVLAPPPSYHYPFTIPV